MRRITLSIAALFLFPALLTAEEPPERPQECERPLTGTVQDSQSGVVLPGSSVRARWQAPEGGVEESVVETESGAVYVLCGLPADTRIVLSALLADREGPPVTVTLPESGETTQALSLPLMAQNTGSIVGRVVERESGRSVTAAMVRVEGLDFETITDGGGRFSIGSVPPGEHTLQVTRQGHGEQSVAVNVPGSRTIDVNVRLAAAAAETAEVPTDVSVRTRSPNLVQRGFYERMERGEARGAAFLTPEDLDRRNPARLSHALGPISNVNIVTARVGGTSIAIPTVGSSPRAGCSRRGAAIYVDQVQQDIADGGLDQVSISSIAAVEVYAPSQVPAEFSGGEASCGVIVVWTGDRSQ